MHTNGLCGQLASYRGSLGNEALTLARRVEWGNGLFTDLGLCFLRLGIFISPFKMADKRASSPRFQGNRSLTDLRLVCQMQSTPPDLRDIYKL